MNQSLSGRVLAVVSLCAAEFQLYTFHRKHGLVSLSNDLLVTFNWNLFTLCDTLEIIYSCVELHKSAENEAMTARDEDLVEDIRGVLDVLF